MLSPSIQLVRASGGINLLMRHGMEATRGVQKLSRLIHFFYSQSTLIRAGFIEQGVLLNEYEDRSAWCRR
jgi:hypothetical protein